MKKRIVSLLLTTVMTVSMAACGAEGIADALPDTEIASGETEEPAPEPKDQKEEDASDATENETVALDEEISADDVSVLWEDSRIYPETSLGKYSFITTYAVKGYEDVPFIRAKEYMDIIFEGKAEATLEDGVIKVSMNETNAVIDPAENTVTFENPAKFRSVSRGVDGPVLETEEVNVVTFSEKNESTQTDAVPLTVNLADYHLPMILSGEDILMPFLAMQNTFGAVTCQNVLCYNGKDYYNITDLNQYLIGKASEDPDHYADIMGESPYEKAVYSGPFSEKENPSQDYANYTYYTTCLLLDLCYGHKEEKDITTFDEYFERIGAKNVLCSTDPSLVMMAESLVFMYLFDSGHDALLPTRTVFGETKEIDSAQAGDLIDTIKQSEGGSDLFDDTAAADVQTAEDLGDFLLGALNEKGFKIPEIAPMMAWTSYFEKAKPEDYGTQRLDYVDDTAVIYFESFMDDENRDPSYYLDPMTEEDADVSNFAYFYQCFEDIKKHDGIKNVVINLSKNGGGRASGLLSILGFISPDGEVEFTDLDILSDSYREEYYHVDTNLDGIADDQDGFGDQYEFFVMTSPFSYSCANALPYFAQKSGTAKVIGANPGGGDCVVGNFLDAYGNCGAFSGMEKIGRPENGEFVSDEKEVTLDLNMMPNVTDINNVPWFDAEGITDAVHQYQDGKTEITYSDSVEIKGLTDALIEILTALQ